MTQRKRADRRTFRNAGRSQAGWKRKGGAGLLAVVLTLSLMVPGQVVAQEVDSPVPDDAVVAAAVPATPGDLDISFSGDGKVTTNFGSSNDQAFAVAVQPNGKIVVAGRASNAVDDDFALARYHAFQCVGFAATRVGTAGNNVLTGTPSADVIIGLGGDDMISGLGGNDVLCGVNGNDTVHGGGGNDTVRGGNGDDALFGEAGTDSCDGGPHVHGDTASSCESVINVP